MKYSQIRTQVSPVRVPDALMGKRAGIFFLLNEIELRKVRARNAVHPDRTITRPSAPVGTRTAKSKAFLLTDEFVFT